jgi:hypothetical protein
MAANYVLLEKITVGAAGASSVTFSGIPQTGYTDLVVKVTGRSTASRAGGGFLFDIRPNGSSANMTRKSVYGDGSTATSGTGSDGQNMALDPSDYTSNTFSSTDIYIPNYTSSAYKSFSTDTVNENNATEVLTLLGAMLWSNTAAITSLQFTPLAGSFVQYSTFYLYGVAKLGTTPAIVPYATGGDTIMTDGTYWYHAFKSSGTFTPAKGLSCDVLVVAGGGGGGKSIGGGGGAGGLFYAASSSVASGTGYTVTIGAGGATSAGASGQGFNGSNSVFGALTAAVGGGGGGGDSLTQYNGLSGGSGGAGGAYSASSGTGGSATSGQGFAGGNGFGNISANTGGGGGGAGAIGSNGAANAPGAGGAGVNTYSAWLSATGTGVSGYVAGGGAGGANNGQTASGGAGGGGNSNNGAGSAGTANTGGGGAGGAGGGANGGAGGSGLVIVRYAV